MDKQNTKEALKILSEIYADARPALLLLRGTDIMLYASAIIKSPIRYD